jgi:hypothetical protein
VKLESAMFILMREVSEMKKLMAFLPMFYLVWHLGAFNTSEEFFKYFDERIAPKKNVKSVEVRPGEGAKVMVVWSEEVGN